MTRHRSINPFHAKRKAIVAPPVQGPAAPTPPIDGVPVLPQTGSATAYQGYVGLGLVVLGATLLVATRRRAGEPG